MYKLTSSQYYQNLGDNRDTSVSVRRSKVEIDLGTGTESIGNHYRLTIDCQTFSRNPNYLHETLIKVLGQSDLDLNVETELKADLDALKAELIAKGWLPATQLITDYEAWQQQQASMMP